MSRNNGPMIAVFMTADIMAAFKDPENGPMVAMMGNGTPIYTRQRLERAVAAGCDTWVVSTRSSLGPHDTWWQAMVQPDHVLLADEEPPGPQNPGSISPWRKLYARLGLTWGESWKSWQDAQNNLPRLGIKLGRDDFKRTT